MDFGFSFQNPTRIHFGRGALDKLPDELAKVGKQVLLVYGTASLKKTGVYDQIMTILRDAGKNVAEVSGVSSNPTAQQVYDGIAIARAHKTNFILAVGGGSVLDCAKAIALGTCFAGDFWQHFYLNGAQPEQALPLGTVLTMAGTGSEMNGGAVITHEETKRKEGYQHGLLYPVFSILDPVLTYTVPKNQMVSGICDILSHIMECYMSPSDGDILSDDLAEAMMRNVIRAAYRALENPENYEARANIMWCATLALSGLLDPAKRQDWQVHQIEHQIGAYTACPHGLGLAAISSNYYRVILPHAPARFARFAKNVWALDGAGLTDKALGAAGIDALERFFQDLGAPTTLRALGMDERYDLDEIADSCHRYPGGYHRLRAEELRALLHATY